MELPVALASIILYLFICIESSVLENNIVKKYIVEQFITETYMLRMENVTKELINAVNNNIELRAELDEAKNIIISYQTDIAILKANITALRQTGGSSG